MNNTMREALLKFGDENPSLDLDFRLHTHGKYLTQEKAIVASRAFKAGAAWQADQSVPEVGRPDCGTCANRGRVDGLSQESFCEHCSWSEKWRMNYYKPIAMQERQP